MKTIAIVEDNPDNLLLLKALLSDFYRLHEYRDGSSAVTGILNQAPDLVLMDISLPRLNGIDALQKIRAHGQFSNLPVIALTAHAMTGDKEQFLAQGFDGYISKPILDIQQLLDPINKMLNTAQ